MAIDQRTCLFWIFLTLLHGSRVIRSAKLFPKMKFLADFSPINSSSTCGTPSIKVCRSSTQTSSLDVCTEDTCKFACCDACRSTKPGHTDLGTNQFNPKVGIVSGAPRPGTSSPSFSFQASSGSYMDPDVVPGINYEKFGFTLSAWIKQKSSNKGTIFSKTIAGNPYTVIFNLEFENYKIWFSYQYSGGNTSVVELTPLQSQSQNLKQDEWHLITVTVIGKDLSYFIDGQFIKATLLKGSINDNGGRIRIGQRYGGGNQYEGLMQDVFMYGIALTNREAAEAFTGVLPVAYVATECRCPPAYPKIMETTPAKCSKNGDLSSLGQSTSRLAMTAHPIELATDGDTTTYWQSELTNSASIYLDLMYGEMQIFYIILDFYGPQPGAIKIERSRDHGVTYEHWQYFAQDCVKSFSMVNNGPLSQPDSVNCLQYNNDFPLKSSGAQISFKTEQPSSESSIPIRPFGSPCTKLHCSEKLLAFLKASHVKFTFYNHTMVKNEKHKYFALTRIVVAGRCECYGHAKLATYTKSNATQHGTCACQCEPATFTEGDKCDRCQPLYYKKSFKRGSITDSYPCVKCECNQHASRCYYNQTLDPKPSSRSLGGGGVCVDCQHNTTGRFCHICQENFYRETGKSLGASDVCTPCRCMGDGVQLNRSDCAKDDSKTGIVAGQCGCKKFSRGRQCDQCKPGYFDLKTSHATGCVTCGCTTSGTVNGNTSCHAVTGQCDCKSNVTGVKCDTCQPGFYGLSALKPTGCQSCGCDPHGSIGTTCDTTTGRCNCKTGSTGDRCIKCAAGYHSPDKDGCKSCNCSTAGSKDSLVKTCDESDGQCFCKAYTKGKSCDSCKVEYFNLSSSNGDGCTICTCDPKGTVGMTRQCEAQSGNCTCKRYVIGQNCNECQIGTYNMSLDNLLGCQPCNCHPKGTQDGNRGCSSNGQCMCLSNVQGEKCDQCVPQYFWNPSSKGCKPCNCHPSGSVGTNCNVTGQCQCKPNIGGLNCDGCLPGSYGFASGNCQPCGCNSSGSLQTSCDDTGKCDHCKKNVEGTKCDKCKPGTVNLKSSNTFGCSGAPSQQAPPFVKVISSRVLGVTWNKPDNPNGIIQRYELYRNGSLVYNGTNRAFNDTGLTPNSYYYYYILTHTEGGRTRSYQDNRVYRTPEDAPEGIAAPSITEVKARSAKVSWQKPNISNGLVTEYRLVSVDSRSSSEVLRCRGLILSCDNSNLKPFTTYNFTVLACNDGGCGRSLTTTIVTKEAAPDSQPMPNTTMILGGRSLIVTWDEPPVPNGKVYRYELYIRGDPFSGEGIAITPNSPVDVRNITVTKLVPYTLYEFRVKSYTAQLDGVTASDWRRVRTAEGVPTGESSIRPRAQSVSSQSIKVTWSLPAKPYGIIVRYVIKTQGESFNETNGIDRSFVVTGLRSYTSYKFTVVACNSYRCTGESASTSERTLPAAPEGQGAPNVTSVDRNSVSLTWNQPQSPNGPLPPTYNVTRAAAAFNYPPQDVTAGVHFPGLGYYKFPANFINPGAMNNIELYFRTQYPDGLLLFLVDTAQSDLLAVELRGGKPWLIFDCQTGPAAFTIKESVRFDDSQWHHLKITRKDQVGTLTVDGTYSNSGASDARSTTIGKNTGVYIGGLPDAFVITRKDSGNAVIKRHDFIGCLKTIKSDNKVFDWKLALEKDGVDPQINACPVRVKSPGVLLRGGGFIVVRPGIFVGGGVLFIFELSFRTEFQSGLLVFAYGPSSHVALHLVNGNINVKLLGSHNRTSYVLNNRKLCDGNWHNVSITAVSIGKNFVITVDGSSHVINPVFGITISSNLYIGGIPLEDTQAVAKARNAGLDPDDTFGGCVRNLATGSKTISFGSDVIRMRNADLDGCVSEGSVNTTHGTCQHFNGISLVTKTTGRYTDATVQAFTDYLYRIVSFHPGTSGSAKSTWVSTRSGPGVPTGIAPPDQVIALDGGRSVQVTWTRPVRPNGLIIYYNIIADNALIGPVVTKVTDVDTLNATVTGLRPYTLYGVRIVAFTLGGNGSGPAVNTTTGQAAPQGVSTPDVASFPRALVVSWQQPSSPNGIITTYNLTFDGLLVYSGTDRSFNITGLQVYTQHALQLVACTVVGCASGSVWTGHTGELPPTGLSLPTLYVKGNDSIRVEWKLPTNPNGVVIKYEVHMSTTESLGPDYKMVYNGSEQHLSAVIHNLTTGTLYYVRVKAFSRGGGTFSNASSARTVSGIPDDIPAPILTALDPYSLHVEILPPRKPNGILTRYELYQDGGQLVVNSTALSNYTARGFKVYSLHRFWVRVCTIKGCNPGEVAEGYTGELPPNGTITFTARIVSAREVTVRWTRAAEPNGDLSYHLTVKGRFIIANSLEMATEERIEKHLGQPSKEWTYGGLLPDNHYELWVNASNTKGFIISNKQNGTTPEAAPDGIRQPVVMVISSTAVNVTWQRPYLPNGVLLGYKLHQKPKNNETVVYSGPDLTMLVTGLDPFTSYQYRISATTAQGTGESNWTSVTTLEDIPGPLDAPHLSPDSKSMLLEWDPPSTPNGVIQVYSIHQNGTFLLNVTSNITKYRVTGLDPFTLYSFAIGACTSVGCQLSQYSPAARTLESVPSGLTRPSLRALSPRSIEIRWDLPNVTNGIIISYSISRRKMAQETPVSIATVNASSPRVYIDNTPQPFTSYEYRVVAYTGAGGGTPSAYSNITTGEGDPENMKAPDVTALSPHELQVRWSAPGIANGYVIEYIVRVLESGRNYSMNSSVVFKYNVAGLKPYIMYSIVIRACTIGGCGESPPTQRRTLPANPSGQPAPSAVVLSSTALRVSWNPPSTANSAIVRYELFRRTVEEPVNQNFTEHTEFVKLSSGSARSLDDTGLGIYSLQSYKVTVITTTGNSTSPSAEYRSGPAPPLAGPAVNTTAVNHTTVLVTWSPPNIRLLRGSVKTYTISYEHINDAVVHQFGSVPGNRTTLAVSGLKPSTNYRFWVELDNNAGTSKSDPVVQRTLDGVPEGFAAPQLFARSNSEIRVSWDPPTTPNGRITVYNIYANGKLIANATASSTQHILTNLLSYTSYNIKVEVCTVYACTKSPARSVRTLASAPRGLAPPRLTPGPDFMVVAWDAPAFPNDIMAGYQLYRRKLDKCPTTPPPISKCTYIECNISQEVCGGSCFDPKVKICCNNDTLHQKDRANPNKQCCGTAYEPKNNPGDVCCGNKFHIRQSSFQCCHDNYMRVSAGNVCCRRGDGGAVVGYGDGCCGDTPYYNNGSKVCVCGGLYDRSPPRKCCGGKVTASAQICCGSSMLGSAYDSESGKTCCGTRYVTEKTTLCCKGPLGSVKVYNYSSEAEKLTKAEKCCNTNRVSSGLACCNTIGYNSTYQTCADRSSQGETDCGTGVVCSGNQASSAKCNRCDFTSSRLCGSVKGYHMPSSVPTTPRICATAFREVLRRPNDPSVFTMKDGNLSPHAEYQYYLVAINTVGNTTSALAKNKTLMASPEGLAPPVATAISASAIRVTWRRPLVSNGILKTYKLIRINQQTKQRKEVYQGLGLTFTDSSGLEPFTGYLYELQACTTECASATASTIVYTDEATPSVVGAPMLDALSSTSINVSWSLPPKPNGRIIRYNVSQVFNDTYKVHLNPNDVGLNMWFIVDKLKPYNNYTFQVTACTKIGCHEGPTASVFTLEAAPQGVHAPTLVATGAREIEATWVEPDVPNGVVYLYSLYRGDALVYNGTSVCSRDNQGKYRCIYKDTGLKPMTSYNYSVAAATKGGKTVSSFSTAQTPESSPEGIPLPRLTPRSAYEVYVEWDPPQTPNGVIVRYAIIVDGTEHNSSLNTNKAVGGLKPYTRYAFQVKACTSKGCGIGDRAYARTSEASPTAVNAPKVEAKEWNVVYVSWGEPASPNGVVTEYRVERKHGNEVPVIVCLTRGPTLPTRTCLDSSGGLKGYTTYNYRILAKNGAGTGQSSWSSVRTMEGPPRRIKQPTVYVINATAVTATWEAPLEPNGIIRYYELRYQPLNVVDGNISVAGRVDSSTFNMTVNVLTPNTDYQFLVTAINSRREGSSSWTLAKTKEAPPTDLNPLKADRLPGGTSLRLYWDPPGSPNGIILRYSIYRDGFKVYEGKTQEYTVIKLTPFTAYAFQLEACTLAGCTKGITRVIFSSEVNPTGQAPPTSGFVNETVVVLNWRQPVVPNGVILRFDVVRSASALQARKRRSVSESIVYTTNETNATTFTYMDTGLSPYTRYKYRIRAVNKGGQTDSDWVVVDTKQARPSLVSAPTVTALDAYRLNVSWTKPGSPNGIIQYYLIYRNGSIIHKGVELHYLDQGREPFTIYSYTVSACSGGGCTDSIPTSQRTKEAASAQVSTPTLTAISAIAIRIDWTIPGKPNGLITEYKLYEGNSLNPLYSGTDLSFTVSAKKPYTEYTFSIAACTKVGCTKSLPAKIRTLQSPPGRMEAPVATVSGSRSVRIEWKPPVNPNGRILYYTLTRDIAVVYNGSDVRFDDYNVAPYTVYSYKVYAVNSAGRGTESPAGSNTPTNPGAPDNVTTPELHVQNSNSIRVKWKEPGRPNGIISKYYVLYNNQEKDVGLTKDIVLGGLSSYTLYSVKIKACTTSVACSVGEAATARTFEAPPMSQGRPVFPSEHIEARKVLVTWNAPVKPNGVIVLYVLHRRQVFRPTRRTSYSPVVVAYNGTNDTILSYNDFALNPYSEYEYRVTSRNSVGSTTSGWAVVKTLTAIPENIPSPQITNTYENRIEILIKPPVKPNGEIRNYILQVSGTNVSTGLELSRIASSLDAFKVYSIGVYACTDAGCTLSPMTGARTSEGTPAQFNAPKIVKTTSRSVELAWGAPGQPNGILIRYEVLHRVTCVASCELPANGTSVGLQRNATVQHLMPYITYDFMIRVHNQKHSGLSETKAARTLPEDPVARSPPRYNVTGHHVTLDWSECFILNGPLDEYTVLERGIIIFRGLKTSSVFPNREPGDYLYEVIVVTIVNGEQKTARSKVEVEVKKEGVVVPPPSAQPQSVPVYRTVWFIAVIALVAILILFVLLALCLRKRSGDRVVYVREREPLPSRTKMHSRPPSMSSLYSSSDRKAGSMIDLNTFNSGSAVALFDGRSTPKPERYDSYDRYVRYNRYNRSLDLTNGSVKSDKFGMDESSDWNVDLPQSNSNKDSGLFVDDKLAFSDSDDDSTPRQSFKREHYFTDTHL